MVQFSPWFKSSFLLFLGMVMYDNEFETKEKKIYTKDKIEPQHIYQFVWNMLINVILMIVVLVLVVVTMIS